MDYALPASLLPAEQHADHAAAALSFALHDTKASEVAETDKLHAATPYCLGQLKEYAHTTFGAGEACAQERFYRVGDVQAFVLNLLIREAA